ncbi:hypothetical protein J6590_040983 [Homalodisca vitripennis]|nr:hypothetical protein J6590_040983 [Homalodisca vitripennis]
MFAQARSNKQLIPLNCDLFGIPGLCKCTFKVVVLTYAAPDYYHSKLKSKHSLVPASQRCNTTTTVYCLNHIQESEGNWLSVKYAAIQCTESCGTWFHAKCVNLDEKKLTKMATSSWLCPGCMASKQPSKTTVRVKQNTVNEEYFTSNPEHSARGVDSKSSHSPLTKNNSLTITELENSLLENDPTNNEDRLKMAATIGAALLEENKSLKGQITILKSKLDSRDAQIEEIKEQECNYLRKIEDLLTKMDETQAQLNKEKQEKSKIQQIYQDHAIEQEQLITNHINRIKSLEIKNIQMNKRLTTARETVLSETREIETQTPTNYALPPPNSSLLLEIAQLKVRQEQMENKLMSFSEQIHKYGVIQAQEETLEEPLQKATPPPPKIENLCNNTNTNSVNISTRNKRLRECRGKNFFSVSLQNARYLAAGKGGSQTEPKLHTFKVSKCPPITAKQLGENETLEEFFNTNFNEALNLCPLLSVVVDCTEHQENTKAIDTSVLPQPTVEHLPLVKARRENYTVPKTDTNSALATYIKPAIFFRQTQDEGHEFIVESTIRSTQNQNKLQKLTIAHHNIDGLQNKIDRLTHFLHNSNPDLIILTEHGLSREKLENTRILGFSLIGDFARQRHRKGGVAVFANLKLEYKIAVTSISRTTSELICESILLKIELKQKFLHLLSIYKPPCSNLENAINFLSSELDKIVNINDPILVMGDVNVDNLVDSCDKRTLDEMLLSYGLRRL